MEKKTFTDDQLVRYRRAFDVYDMNSNGCIEVPELRAIAIYMGYRISEKQIFQIIKKLDLNEKGVITFDDFLKAMPGTMEQMTEEECRSALCKQKFGDQEPNAQGLIPASRAKEFLRKELHCSSEQFSSLVAHFHLDEMNNLNLDDFVELYDSVTACKDRVMKSFEEFDQDNKGFVSVEDAQRAMSSYGFTDKEIIQLFNAHDKDNDNLLNFEEFLSFWGVCIDD